MSTPDNPLPQERDSVAQLLKHAQPRSAPPADAENAIRQAVTAEWRSVVASRRSRVRRWQLAVAASLVAGIALLLATLPRAPVAVTAVASIDRSVGTVYLLAEQSELVELPTVSMMYAGQLVQTGGDGLLGLTWGGGGSLRMDHDSKIEFVDAQTVFLHRGRIYVDVDPAAGESSLVIKTDGGTARHVGTQYLVSVGSDELVISVREGQVHIGGRLHNGSVTAGKQVRLRGSAPPQVSDVARFGALWQWTEALSPGIDLNNRSALDFLQWVGRETGHQIVFESPAAKQLAADTQLIGSVATDPRTELRLRMMTTDLEYMIDNVTGQISVRMAGDGGG